MQDTDHFSASRVSVVGRGTQEERGGGGGIKVLPKRLLQKKAFNSFLIFSLKNKPVYDNSGFWVPSKVPVFQRRNGDGEGEGVGNEEEADLSKAAGESSEAEEAEHVSA